MHYLALHAHFRNYRLVFINGNRRRLSINSNVLISKYTNNKILWIIYGLLNAGLISLFFFFFFLLLFEAPTVGYYLPIGMLLAAVILFGRHCYLAYIK